VLALDKVEVKERWRDGVKEGGWGSVWVLKREEIDS
jgi:hypothetical protein